MVVSESRYLVNGIGDYVERLRYEDLPPEVVQKVKHHILDTLGVSLYGSGMPWAAAVYRVVRDLGGTPESVIVRYGDRTSCTMAALANGTFAHSNDFDDNYGCGPLHPSAGAVWTAIPLAEKLGQGGREVILSIVIGHDLTIRLGEASFSGPAGEGGLAQRGFHAQAVCQAFGSAAQASKQLGLDSDGCASALGVAGSYASGLKEFLKDGAHTKRFHLGKASQDGITAALLAANGFTGPRSVMEGRSGFLRTYFGEYDASKLLEELGNRFDIMSVAMKKYPTCYGNQSSVEGFLALMGRHNLNAENIEEVNIEIRPMFVPTVFSFGGDPSEKYRPSSILSANLSLPYAIAVAMANGDVRLEHWEDEKRLLTDDRLASFAARVKVEGIEEFAQLPRNEAYAPSRLTISTRDGRSFTQTTLCAKGHPRNLMTEAEIFGKFKDTAGRVLAPSKLDAIIDRVMTIDRLQDIRDLTQLLS